MRESSISTGVAVPPEQTKRRNLVVLMLDVSNSMDNEFVETYPGETHPIDELNSALTSFAKTDLHRITVLEKNGEIAIGAFGGEDVRWQKLAGQVSGSPFYYCQSVTGVPTLSASGSTPMHLAITETLDVIAGRKESLRKQGKLHQYRPVAFLLTDGKPSRSLSSPEMRAAMSRLRTEEDAKHVLFYALGTSHADHEVMQQVTRGYFPLQDQPIASYIQFLSNSIGVEEQGVDDGAEATYERQRERHNKLFAAVEDWKRK